MADTPKLEREASAIANGDWAPGNHVVQVSIALSLKRIADFLDAVKTKDEAKRAAKASATIHRDTQ